MYAVLITEVTRLRRASSEALTATFEKAGSGYELHIGNGMFHCYPAIRFIPECREAFDEIVGYLRGQEHE